jgi:hypothetical protein
MNKTLKISLKIIFWIIVALLLNQVIGSFADLNNRVASLESKVSDIEDRVSGLEDKKSTP